LHDHDHAPGHVHGAPDGNARRLAAVLCLSAAYMLAEVAGGLLTGSLALLADAGHMLSDVASLAFGLFALRISQRPATPKRTFGNTRVEILAALAQGVALAAVALLIAVEAFERFGSAREIDGVGMLLVALGGLAVNGVGLFVLGSARKDSLNLRGVWLHVASDALGSLGVIVAGCAVWLFGWLWADPAVSIAIAALVLFGAWKLVRDAVDVLMEAAPGHLDVEEIRGALEGLPGVDGVHDLHVWTIGNREISLSSHVVSPAGGDPNELLSKVRGLLDERFSIRHSTVQIEIEDGSSADCEGACETPGASASARR
jgi:cobalt-zinc-cadmium efflux system protein